jgi:pimeloyl-ACP methyl ester carboxylesterase
VGINRQWPTARTFPAAAAITLDGIDNRAFAVQEAGFGIPCFLGRQPGADRLYVLLNGAVDRKITPLPAFARWNWRPIFKANLLCVGDPTLYLDEKLRLGWYLGTADRDPIDGLLAILARVAEALGIPPEKVIFYASSGGGFAGLRAAARLPVGRCVAINPQIEIFRYHPPLGRIMRVFAPKLSEAEITARWPERWSAIEAVRQGLAQGHDLRIALVQNRVDAFHHAEHYSRFCEALGLPPAGGPSADGRMISMLFDAAAGHGPEPPNVARRIIEELVPFLLR